MDIRVFAKKFKIPHFRGVFMRDELLKLKAPHRYESAILNLDDARGEGSHWVAYKKKRNKIFYFDSFGSLPPPIEAIKYFNTNDVFYNYDNYQKFDTYNCGHLCLEFLLNKSM